MDRWRYCVMEKIKAAPPSGTLRRCPWAGTDPLYVDYHDREWGVPVHDDRHLFEMLILEGVQAGLSWRTILHKRQNYRRAFDNFNPEKVARYTRKRIDMLLSDEGIVRNRLKVEAAVTNAQAFLDTQEAFGSFDTYLWQFVGGRTKVNRWRSMRQVPARSRESDAMSKDLRARGFKFVGSTICYAFMQTVGMVNDHLITCWRYADLISRAEV